MTDTQPAWAMEKARRVVLSLWPDMDAKSQKKIDETPIVQAIARAIAAERESAAKIAENYGDLVDGLSATLIAAAIRKGE